MRSRPARLTCVLAVAAIVGTFASACSSKTHKSEPFTSPAPSVSTTTPAPTPSKKPVPAPTNPFTGLAGDPQPVLAIKVDNAPAARPQAGLNYADIVYEEIVEGGSTRFLAIFASRRAPRIEPVRSVRESDIELLKQYGRVVFAYSGGNSGVIAMVEAANLLTASAKKLGVFHLDPNRHRPYSTYASAADILAAKPGGERAKDVGLRFGSRFTGVKASHVTVPFSPLVTTSFTWSATQRVWLRSTNRGPAMLADGNRMSTPNVIVQLVRVHPSRFVDRAGNNTPYSITTGSGDAYVLRDGQAVRCHWFRKTGSNTTHFADNNGHDVLLHPGPVWILLAKVGTRVGLAA